MIEMPIPTTEQSAIWMDLAMAEPVAKQRPRMQLTFWYLFSSNCKDLTIKAHYSEIWEKLSESEQAQIIQKYIELRIAN